MLFRSRPLGGNRTGLEGEESLPESRGGGPDPTRRTAAGPPPPVERGGPAARPEVTGPKPGGLAPGARESASALAATAGTDLSAVRAEVAKDAVLGLIGDLREDDLLLGAVDSHLDQERGADRAYDNYFLDSQP